MISNGELFELMGALCFFSMVMACLFVYVALIEDDNL